MANKKEVLSSFGGTVDIDKFRSGFMTVKSLDFLERCFDNNASMTSNLNSITSDITQRRFTYCFESMSMISEEKEGEKQKEELQKPTLHQKIVKHKSLF